MKWLGTEKDFWAMKFTKMAQGYDGIHFPSSQHKSVNPLGNGELHENSEYDYEYEKSNVEMSNHSRVRRPGLTTICIAALICRNSARSLETFTTYLRYEKTEW